MKQTPWKRTVECPTCGSGLTISEADIKARLEEDHNPNTFSDKTVVHWVECPCKTEIEIENVPSQIERRIEKRYGIDASKIQYDIG